MQMNKDRMLSEFSTLVSIDSPSFGERRMAAYLKKELQQLGFAVEEDSAAERLGGTCGNLYAYLEGHNSTLPPLLFSAHMDTVEPAAGKRAVVHDDGRITSAGNTVLGADDCAGLAAILEAVRSIREQGLAHRPIEVLFTVAEEVYCKGAQVFDFSRVRAREGYVLDLTGPIGSAAYEAPSIFSFTISLHGKAAHAGFAPEDGVHAIAVAAQAVSRLQMGRINTDTTLNIGTIEGGVATNIVPDRCILRGEIRSFSHEEALRQARQVEQVFSAAAQQAGARFAFESVCHCKAYHTPPEHPVVRRFLHACEAQGLSPALQRTLGGSDNNYLAGSGIVGIVLANAMYDCHSTAEYTTADELVAVAQLTARLMTSTF